MQEAHGSWLRKPVEEDICVSGSKRGEKTKLPEAEQHVAGKEGGVMNTPFLIPDSRL